MSPDRGPAPELLAREVSVVIPAYQAATTIGRALESVARQTVKPAEIVVVDDGSADGTPEAARAFDGRLNGIDLRVIGQPNRGAGAARNRAIAEASGSLLAFLDADDAWLPDKLERSLPHLADPAVAFCAHDFVVVDGEREQRRDCARHFAAADDPYLALFRRPFVATSTVIARRDAIAAAGGFDESLRSGQDYALWLKIAGTEGWTFTVFPGALTRYFVTAGSISTHIERRRKAAFDILRRHVGELRKRGEAPLASALLRGAIIVGEAATAHRRAGHWLSAIAVFLTFPYESCRIAWCLMSGRRTGA